MAITINQIKNNKKIFYLELCVTLLSLIFSVVNHFVYEVINCPFIMMFVPISESIWEHGKLLFMPFLFFSLIEYIILLFTKDNDKKLLLKLFSYAKAIPLTFCVPFMIVFYYTYSGIIGTNIAAVDILLALSIVLYMNYFSINSLLNDKKTTMYWFLAVIIIFLLFIVFTFYQPRIALFLE